MHFLGADAAHGRGAWARRPQRVSKAASNDWEAADQRSARARAGGGYWEAMHGDMTGFFEVRSTAQTGGTSGSSACSNETEPTWDQVGRAS